MRIERRERERLEEQTRLGAVLGVDDDVTDAEIEALLHRSSCGLCAQEFDSRVVRMRVGAGGFNVCPGCVDTPRGRQALESPEARYRRLFGPGTRKGTRR